MSKLTLNVFEPRYLEMIDRSVEEGIPLAIAPSYSQNLSNEVVQIDHESTPFVFQYCGHGSVQILGDTAKGTKLIMVEGVGKGKILDVHYQGSFNTVTIESVDQEAELDENNIFIFRRLKSLTKEMLAEKLGRQEEVEAIMSHLEEPQSLVAFYSDHLLQDFEKHLEVFKVNSLHEKLQLLGNYRVHH